jgi:hypothetical protein
VAAIENGQVIAADLDAELGRLADLVAVRGCSSEWVQWV